MFVSAAWLGAQVPNEAPRDLQGSPWEPQHKGQGANRRAELLSSAAVERAGPRAQARLLILSDLGREAEDAADDRVGPALAGLLILDVFTAVIVGR